MKKIFKNLFWGMIIILFVINFHILIKNYKKVEKYKEEYIKIRQDFKLKYSLLGRKIKLNNFSGINEKSNIIKKEKKYKYILLMVLPKINCGQCISKFAYYLNNLKNRKIKSFIIGFDKENMIRKKRQYLFEKEVFYINDYNWFNEYGIKKGPILLILDLETNKVLNLFYGLYFIEDLENKFMEYIDKLNI